jgi:hypothetical protein
VGYRVGLSDFRKNKKYLPPARIGPTDPETPSHYSNCTRLPPSPAFEECAVFCIQFLSVTYSPHTSVSHVGKSSYTHYLKGSDFTTQTVKNNHGAPIFHYKQLQQHRCVITL